MKVACGQNRRQSGKTRKEKVAGKLSAEKDSSWENGHSAKRTTTMLTFFEDSIDRKTQQCVLKEKKQLACRLPARARGPCACEPPSPSFRLSGKKGTLTVWALMSTTKELTSC